MEQDITRDDLRFYAASLTPEKADPFYNIAIIQDIQPTAYWKLDKPHWARWARIKFNKQTHEVVWEDETETEVTLVIKPRADTSR